MTDTRGTALSREHYPALPFTTAVTAFNGDSLHKTGLKIVALLGVASILFIAASDVLTNRSVAHLLRSDATQSADDWVAKFIGGMQDFDSIIDGRPMAPVDADHVAMATSSKRADVPFRIFDRTGVVRLQSASFVSRAQASDAAEFASSVMAAGRTAIDLSSNAGAFDRPTQSATVYVPVQRHARTVAAVEVTIDQSKRQSMYRGPVSQIVYGTGVIGALLFGGPSILIYLLSLQLRRTNRQIRFLASHDAVTALPDRAQFHDAIARALKHAEFGATAGILCLDIDGFSDISARLGRAVGDDLLKLVAARLKHTTRHGDMVARLNGDTFGIVQPLIKSGRDCDALIRRLRAKLTEPYLVGEHSIHISVSFGVALLPHDANTAAGSLNAAYRALSHSKNCGRGLTTYFAAAMSADD